MTNACVCTCVQVRSGLRNGGFVRAVEAWWGPAVGADPLPDNYDGPLCAVKLTFSDKTEPVVSLLAWQLAAVGQTCSSPKAA
jgi:hypothetical protein